MSVCIFWALAMIGVNELQRAFADVQFWTIVFIGCWFVAALCFLIGGLILRRDLKKIELMLKDVNSDLATVAREAGQIGRGR